MGITIKIFISYSQEDFFARGVKIKNYLSKLIPDAEIYIDQDKSKGQDWQAKNDEKLEKAKIVIVILTPAALPSHEIEREVKIAIDGEKRILPCKDDNLDLPWKDVPWGLSTKDGITFDEDEVLKTRLYREVHKIVKEMLGKSTRKVAESATFEVKAKIKHGDIPLVYNKRYWPIPYFVSSGEVSDLSGQIDNDALSVILNITCKEDSTISITLPRKLIDSKLGSKDDWFYILVNGEGTNSIEDNEKDTRTLDLVLKEGDNSVEIIGNQLLGISIFGARKNANVVRILQGSSAPKLDKYLEPDILRIKEGEGVTWSNDDYAAHTITSGSPERGPDGMFDSNLVMSGSTYSISFNKKGEFDYFCMLHPWKKGKIIVE